VIGLAAPECVQCKQGTPAMVYAFFAELENAARALPWCESCMDEILPVLLHWGFAVNLQPADRPAALQVCEYGQECPRLCKAGFRACPEHLIELREVYAGKESGASVDPVSDEPDWRAVVTEARQAADQAAAAEAGQ
jgi:hypothetical protein